MPWYREGTVAVTAGQTTVTGTGTNFSINARVGDAFQGPDGRWYEVANIASTTVMGILPAYQGATVAAGSYGLAPMQGYVKEAADRLRQIVDQFGGTLALFGGATDVATLRQNIGAAARGENSDITRLSGLTTALSVAQGGTGGTSAPAARAGLGLRDLALLDLADIAHGGTGATTAAGARQALGLGSAATRAVGTAEGNLMEIAASEIVQGNSAFIVPGSRFVSYAEGITTGAPPWATYAAGIRSRYGDGSFFAIDIVGSIFNAGLYWRSVNASGVSNGWRLIYDTTNTTRAADGTLKAV